MFPRRGTAGLAVLLALVAGGVWAADDEAKTEGTTAAEGAEALKDKDAGVRYKAALALGRLGSAAKGVTGALAVALKDAHAGVRREAAYALGMIGPEARESAAALVEALKHADADLRGNA